MTTKLAKWASEMIELSNQERRMATRKNSFCQRRCLTTIGSDLKVIWGMSVKALRGAGLVDLVCFGVLVGLDHR